MKGGSGLTTYHRDSVDTISTFVVPQSEGGKLDRWQSQVFTSLRITNNTNINVIDAVSSGCGGKYCLVKLSALSRRIFTLFRIHELLCISCQLRGATLIKLSDQNLVNEINSDEVMPQQMIDASGRNINADAIFQNNKSTSEGPKCLHIAGISLFCGNG